MDEINVKNLILRALLEWRHENGFEIK